METFYALEQATHLRISELSQQKAQINLASQVLEQEGNPLQTVSKHALTAPLLRIFHSLLVFRKNVIASPLRATSASKLATAEHKRLLPNSTQVQS